MRLSRLYPLLLILCFLIFGNYLSIAKNQVVQLVCEYHVHPIGIDVEKPRFSWQIVSEEENVQQTAYEIRVAHSPKELNKKSSQLWASGKVESAQSVNIEYQGTALKSMQRAYWQVRVWYNNGKVTDWSEPAYWETGILSYEEWNASWITMKEEMSEESYLPMQGIKCWMQKKPTAIKMILAMLFILRGGDILRIQKQVTQAAKRLKYVLIWNMISVTCICLFPVV